jgi:hypothetical protein
MTFLERAARHIFEQHAPAELSRIGVVLPTRRAVFFFKQELARQAATPLLAPDVWAIEDFVTELAEVKLAEPVAMLFELYDVFREIDPQIQFDRFMTWAGILLQDFDRIDQYGVDARALFAWVSEAKAIERWWPDAEQRPADWQVRPGTAPARYFRLFENLDTVYTRLRERLQAKGLAYRGMAYRLLADEVFDRIIVRQLHERYYFLGFNALSVSEEKIITGLVQAKRAEVLWDSDAYYMDANPRMEAGKLLRRYRADARFGSGRGWQWQTDDLLRGEKHIRIVGVPNASMQAKLAGHLYKEWGSRQSGVESRESAGDRGTSPGLMTDDSRLATPACSTAIVLGDESLLQPLLFSLDESVRDYNVTMGVSLRHSLLFTLIDGLFELQRNFVEFRTADGAVRQIPKYNHRQVLKLLNHPFIRQYESVHFRHPDGTNPVRHAVREITRRNWSFLSEAELFELGGGHPLFRALFARWHDDSGRAIAQLYALIDLLREVYREAKDAIETEYLYEFYTLLRRLEALFQERPERVSLRSFRNFLYELVRQTKIPFNGEPVSSLQIMGMLETRTLDFERLIVLSVNEGTLPVGKKMNSLIPHDAAVEFRLPTHHDQDAVMSYHFFRLLQRAKEVVLVHVLPSDTYGGGEKSRFLLQIEHELRRANPNLTISYPEVVFEPPARQTAGPVDGVLVKSPELLAQLRAHLTERGLAATPLNNLIQCSMRYYFSQLTHLSDADETDDTLGADQFGTWLHETLEGIDQEAVARGGVQTRADVEQVLAELPARLERQFRAAYPGLPFGEGVNHILFQVAHKLLRGFFEQQLATGTFPVEILDVERKRTVTIEVDGLPVKINGRIDRLDRVNGTLRVVDYKTGVIKDNELKVKPEFLEEVLLRDRTKGKFRQLWLYRYLIEKQLLTGELVALGTPHVQAGMYSFRAVGRGFQTEEWAFRPGETPAEFVAESEGYLRQFVRELLDPAVPFQKSDDLAGCVYCDYKRLCGR